MDRIITVITDEGTEVRTESNDADEHLDSLDLIPTSFIKEVKRKLDKE